MEKVIKKIKEHDERVCVELSCGHYQYVLTKDSQIGTVIPCNKCYLKNSEQKEYYDYKFGMLLDDKVNKKCHLCGELETLNNLTPKLSSNNKYYFSHNECIVKNNGFATKKENIFKKNKRNTKVSKCRFCGEKTKGKICKSCVSISLKYLEFKEFGFKSESINQKVYDFCRENIKNWKSSSYSIANKEGIDTRRFNIAHHAFDSFLTLYYIALKIKLENKELALSNIIKIVHYYSYLGIPVEKEFHDYFHSLHQGESNNIENFIIQIDKFYNGEMNEKYHILIKKIIAIHNYRNKELKSLVYNN